MSEDLKIIIADIEETISDIEYGDISKNVLVNRLESSVIDLKELSNN